MNCIKALLTTCLMVITAGCSLTIDLEDRGISCSDSLLDCDPGQDCIDGACVTPERPEASDSSDATDATVMLQ